MAETIKKYLNDSFAARWAALILIALAMFFAYMFVDVMSPLQSLVEKTRGWNGSVFGTYAASGYILLTAMIFVPKCSAMNGALMVLL